MHASILLDAAPRVLPGFTPGLSNSAKEQLKQMDVEVHVDTKVLNVTEEGVQLENEFIRTRTVIWAAGNAASPLAKQLDGETDRQGSGIGRRRPERPEASRNICDRRHRQFLASNGAIRSQALRPLPCRWEHTPLGISWSSPKAETSNRFKYRDKGSMATIGRNKAVADLKVIRFGGFLAWLSWLFVHLLFLVGLRNQMLVFFQWTWAYFTYARGARLIYRPIPAGCSNLRASVSTEDGNLGVSEHVAIDWSSWQPKELATLCFVRQGFRVLMIRKKRGLGAGKLTEWAGRLEEGETPEVGVVREAREELGITPLDAQTGRANCISNFWTATVFFAPCLSRPISMGMPIETEEAAPLWFDIRQLPFNEMWEDDELWLREALDGKFFRGFFVFDGEKMLSDQLEWG